MYIMSGTGNNSIHIPHHALTPSVLGAAITPYVATVRQ